MHPHGPRREGLTYFQGFLLVALVLAAYWPAVHGGFILDDDVFLTRNPLIHAADGLRRFWCTTQAADYWPLTSTSLWLEWRLWGMNPTGYHLTNLCLHAAECLLLWRLLVRLEVPGAYLCSLVFAVHPLNVESVAWITQRKGLMAMLFFLLSIDATLSAEGARLRGARASGNAWYLASLGAYGLALVSKASVAPLPLVLYGLIAWSRRPTLGDLGRLVPFFAAAIIAAAVNVWFQRHGTGEVFRTAGWADRIAAATTVPWFYLWKVLAPFDLMLVYPQWHPSWAEGRWWLGLLAIAGVAAGLSGGTNPWRRRCLFGLAYFGVMLTPVLGLTDVAFMRFSLVSDHYVHLALIGPLALVAAGIAGLTAWNRCPAALVSVATLGLVGGMFLLTWRYAGAYTDAVTLYRRSLASNPGSSLLHNNLAYALQSRGLRAEALEHYEEALRLNPTYAEAHNNLGELYSELGQEQLAIRHCQEAVRLRPAFPDANDNLGVLYARQGRLIEATDLITRAIRERPDFAEAHVNLGIILRAQGRPAEANAEFEIARRLRAEP